MGGRNFKSLGVEIGRLGGREGFAVDILRKLFIEWLFEAAESV